MILRRYRQLLARLARRLLPDGRPLLLLLGFGRVDRVESLRICDLIPFLHDEFEFGCLLADFTLSRDLERAGRLVELPLLAADIG